MNKVYEVFHGEIEVSKVIIIQENNIHQSFIRWFMMLKRNLILKRIKHLTVRVNILKIKCKG